MAILAIFVVLIPLMLVVVDAALSSVEEVVDTEDEAAGRHPRAETLADARGLPERA